MSLVASLKRLLHSLTDEEFERFRRQYVKKEEGAGRDPSRARDFIQELREKKVNQNDEIEENRSPALAMLALRIRDDLLDFLIHHDQVEKDETLTEVAKAKILVKKLFAHYQVLGFRGHYQEAIETLNKIATIAETYEFYEDAIHALGDLSNLYAGFNDLRNFERVTQKLDEYARAFNAYRRALQLYNASSLRIVFRPDTLGTHPEMEKEMNQIKQLYYEHQRPRIGWFYHHITMRYHLVRREYLQAEEAGYRMLELQRMHPSIGAESMIGATYNMLAHAQMHRFRFDYALESIQQAQYYFRRNKVNLSLAKELEFLCRLYTRRLEKAEELVDELLESTSERTEKFKWSFRQYLKACLYFLEGDFNKANKIMVMEVHEIDKDREGHNINSRILDLMVLIESQMFDVAFRRLESFRKHMERLSKEGEVKERLAVIFKILKELSDNDFNFRRLWAARKSVFDALNGDEATPLAWEILSSEVLPFHVWFESKATNLPFYDVLFKFFAKRRGPDVYFLDSSQKAGNKAV